MRYLTTSEILDLHRLVIERTRGSMGIRDLNLLESAVAQPAMTFGGVDLYPTFSDKGAALAFSLIKNHPFVDGNKRAGHAAMETFLMLNGHEINAPVDEQEQIILQVAAGTLSRQEFTDWVRVHIVEKTLPDR
jgi:death-on-curing protein